MSPARALCPVAGVTVAGASVWLGSRVAASPAWSDVGDMVRADLLHRPGGWVALRAVAGPLGVPLLVVVLLLLLYATWQRSRRDALVLGAVAVAGSATIQIVAPVVLPVMTASDPLSGHIGVATSVGLGWLVVARTGSAWRTAGVALGIMGLTVVAMVLAGWHTLPEIIVSVGIPAGWAVAALGAAAPDGLRWSVAQAHAADACLLLGGAVLATTALLAHQDPDASGGRTPILLLATAGIGVVLVAVGAVLGLRLALAAHDRLLRLHDATMDGDGGGYSGVFAAWTTNTPQQPPR